ncbi:creatininase family protein [Streptomyces sp. PLAI1-29]|uniref:Creatininase family protein n=1 Tax=Streptomyces zingiberis TaxID=2053010 RepID=A0ABX1BPD1_9ACTN|nr:creatininase family protein [Streptomyces zingiberis]NJP99585.1 creatininase family protein [Streptomyces zingiberis]
MTRSGKRLPASGLLPADTTEDVRAAGAAVALLPVGSFEQHGPYLPLVTDTVVACAVARELAAVYPVQCLPPITLSCSHEHAGWPGTVSLSAATLCAVVADVAASLRRSGVRGLVLVNGHGGNYVLRNVVQESAGSGTRMALFPGPEDWDAARKGAEIRTSSRSDMHAGEVETSILLHDQPELLRPGYETADHLADERRHLLTLGMRPYTESGVIGRPSLASAEKGRKLLAGLVDSFADCLALFAGETVEAAEAGKAAEPAEAGHGTSAAPAALGRTTAAAGGPHGRPGSPGPGAAPASVDAGRGTR